MSLVGRPTAHIHTDRGERTAIAAVAAADRVVSSYIKFFIAILKVRNTSNHHVHVSVTTYAALPFCDLLLSFDQFPTLTCHARDLYDPNEMLGPLRQPWPGDADPSLIHLPWSK